MNRALIPTSLFLFPPGGLYYRLLFIGILSGFFFSAGSKCFRCCVGTYTAESVLYLPFQTKQQYENVNSNNGKIQGK